MAVEYRTGTTLMKEVCKMKRVWKERTKIEKILAVLKLLVSLIIVYASTMKFFGIWPKALNVAIPLFAVYYLVETIYNWKRDTDMAAISLLMTVIISIISCAVFFS